MQSSTEELENKHVKQVYNLIGHRFSSSRHTPWSTLKDFIDTLPPDSYVLDAGCGNGKNMMIRDDLSMIGCDQSATLVDICCNERGLNVVQADIISLPFADQAFDAVICVAVLHHIASAERRSLAIKELLRVLKHGGKLFIIVWALEQNLEKSNKFMRLPNGNNDFLVSWENTYQRFYHLFDEAEIKKVFPSATISFAKDNWHITIVK